MVSLVIDCSVEDVLCSIFEKAIITRTVAMVVCCYVEWCVGILVFVGSLSSSIGNLKYLVSLDLTGNLLTGML